MKLYILIISISFGTISCKQKANDTPISKPDHLSAWFIQNEDSLYKEFNELVQTELFQNRSDTNWGEYAFQNADSTKFMGRFTLEAKKYCDSLEVTFFYNKKTTPCTRILISANYNRKFTTALDTIFNFVPKPKYFIVEKYEQPDLHTDGFSFPNLNIDNKDLRILMQPEDTLQNLKIFIYTKAKNVILDADNKDFLQKQLFGEELILKKIKDIDCVFTDTINSTLLTLNEVRNKLK